MNVVVLGAAGFIGTNLIRKLASNDNNKIKATDVRLEYLDNIKKFALHNVELLESDFGSNACFDTILENQDVVYHLVSTTIPANSNKSIYEDFNSNVLGTINLLDSCVKCGVKKVVFISSGGTVYGKDGKCPLSEDDNTNPISSYGLQKLTIEKILQVYNYEYQLDYRVVRLSNPYGPYQRPNGKLGAVTTFIYKILKGESINVFGDGSVVRDYIYIDDAIEAIFKIAASDCTYKLFNVGRGCGVSIDELLHLIQKVLNKKADVTYVKGRNTDVPVNFLDVSRYRSHFGEVCVTNLEDGIIKTAEFLKQEYL